MPEKSQNMKENRTIEEKVLPENVAAIEIDDDREVQTTGQI